MRYRNKQTGEVVEAWYCTTFRRYETPNGSYLAHWFVANYEPLEEGGQDE